MARAEDVDPLPCHQGVGIRPDPPPPGGCRRPGWPPCRGAAGRWWQQGSRVTYSVAPAGSSVQALSASRSAWRPPHRACQPCPMTRPSRTMTAPTRGLGLVQPTPRSASSSRQAHIVRCPFIAPPPSETKMPRTERSRASWSDGTAGRSAAHSARSTRNAPECTHTRIPERIRTWAQAQSSRGRTIFSHPDYTVGPGISPGHAFRLAGCTAGGESHPALKI